MYLQANLIVDCHTSNCTRYTQYGNLMLDFVFANG
jgi:hypothetical protein